jgi:hypothetical protein
LINLFRMSSQIDLLKFSSVIDGSDYNQSRLSVIWR